MFKHKIVAITGAASGIGRALALGFAREGAHLALSDVNESGLAETIALLPAGTQARGYRLDASSWEAFQVHAEEVKRDFGSAHVIINNAGATVIGTVEHTSIEEFRWQIDINLYGVLYGTKAFLPMLLAQREGWIVNISSVFGLVAHPMQGAYNMSKFAVRGLTECLWQELKGSGVQAVCVHPGGIKTNIERAGRRVKHAGAEEEEFAAKVQNMLRTPPEQCAAEIIHGLRAGKKRILPGYSASTLYWLARLLPNSYPALLKWLG